MSDTILIEHSKQFNEAVSALIELESMKAANKARELLGESLAYSDKDFIELLGTYELGHNGNVSKAIRIQS